jgi:hypothetical protein
VFCKKISFQIIFTPFRQPCPQGGGGACDATVLPLRDTPRIIVSTKQKLRPPRGVHRGGGKHRNGGMGASAPIITSMDFYRAEKRKLHADDNKKILLDKKMRIKEGYSSFFSGFLKVSTRTISLIPLVNSNASWMIRPRQRSQRRS